MTKANRLRKHSPRFSRRVKSKARHGDTGTACYALGPCATRAGTVCYVEWDRVLRGVRQGLGSCATESGTVCYANRPKPLVCAGFRPLQRLELLILRADSRERAALAGREVFL